MLKRVIHHPETIGLVIMATMVFFMSNYNMLWRFGIYNYSVKKELFIFPVIFVAVYIVKKYFQSQLLDYFIINLSGYLIFLKTSVSHFLSSFSIAQ